MTPEEPARDHRGVVFLEAICATCNAPAITVIRPTRGGPRP